LSPLEINESYISSLDDIDKIELKSVTLQDAVYEKILTSIIMGRIPPGSRITIDQFAKQFNVSRMPVREALRKLESTKLISVGGNRRIITTKLSTKDLKQILEIRLLLECNAAEKASQLRSESAIEALEKTHKQYTRANTIEEFILANWQFHYIIYHEANMLILMDILDILWGRVSPYFALIYKKIAEGSLTKEKNIRLHEGIFLGMKNKDKEAVIKYLRRDLIYTAEEIAKIISSEK